MARRGSCGRPFSASTPLAEEDERGRFYVEGYVISPGCDATTGSGRLYSCPRAQTDVPGSWVRQVIDLARFTEGHIHNLSSVHGYETPSLALFQAVEEAAHAIEDLRDYKREQARKRAELEAKAANAARKVR